ncbi:MAG TPA: 5-methyltetrahydropteroyltriglutamate--homocysteine S-methyltransferase [Alphaproteobacteria bacterium]|jgi:5-methyltetrahydropteroyltriglutamate--homocysteine methyltransferase|nr:5-methyltetrahydropteroyltriglutamate--homocysteine S-methyltransferase [Alphaproteobacteria bacterium]
MPARLNPPFRADHVGSLLRPPAVLEARERVARGAMTAAQLHEVEDQGIREVVKLQAGVGLKAITDGDIRRRHWFLDFLEKIDGVVVRGGLPLKFHNESGDIDMAPPVLHVDGPLRRRVGLSVDDFAYLQSVTPAGCVAKQTIPSPTIVHFRGGRAAIDRAAYPDLERFFADLARVYREEIAALGKLGCRYLQIDDTNLAYLCDPALRADVKARGDDPDALPHLYARLINDSIKDRPADMAVGLHLCRGNHESSWVAEGGYEPVAEAMFNEIAVDAFFLEYDTPRAGDFRPLRFVPKDKKVVLGLVTTKKPALESKDALKRRIDEAAKFVPLDQLCLSPQCGFASTLKGNALTVEDEKAKLRLVVQTAEEVWGRA